MNKFWNWLDIKEYGQVIRGGKLYDDEKMLIRPTKQMLIGYMIEYLIKNNIGLPRDMINIDEIYKDLKKQIEEME